MTLTVLAKSEAEARAMQSRLAKLQTVDKTISLFNFLPEQQEEKLATIDEMAMTLGQRNQSFPQLKTGTDPLPGYSA